jgi:hypothetical protein
MPMTNEERKEYNKIYYNKYKDVILEKALRKVKCEFCERNVIYNNYNKHIKTSICKRKQNELVCKNERLSLFGK